MSKIEKVTTEDFEDSSFVVISQNPSTLQLPKTLKINAERKDEYKYMKERVNLSDKLQSEILENMNSQEKQYEQ